MGGSASATRKEVSPARDRLGEALLTLTVSVDGSVSVSSREVKQRDRERRLAAYRTAFHFDSRVRVVTGPLSASATRLVELCQIDTDAPHPRTRRSSVDVYGPFQALAAVKPDALTNSPQAPAEAPSLPPSPRPPSKRIADDHRVAYGRPPASSHRKAGAASSDEGCDRRHTHELRSESSSPGSKRSLVDRRSSRHHISVGADVELRRCRPAPHLRVTRRI
jgi:hypothetical protein